ncbi:MAG TPA: hypothetical protein VFI65_04675 [Streptosporangiaceae bacterium]|nr:hypothetical protein [Streptosporangiaceae bacterium]
MKQTFWWLAAGGILLFAVSGQPSFLNLKTIGLIMIGRGVAGVWFAAGPDRRAYFARQIKSVVTQGSSVVETATADLAQGDSNRVPLGDLLLSRRADGGDRT